MTRSTKRRSLGTEADRLGQPYGQVAPGRRSRTGAIAGLEGMPQTTVPAKAVAAANGQADAGALSPGMELPGSDAYDLNAETEGKAAREGGDKQDGHEREVGVKVSFVANQQDVVSKLLRMVTVNEAPAADDVAGMVESILAKADGNLIAELVLNGHGFEGRQRISDSAELNVSALDDPEVVATLALLRDHFTSSAEVVFLGCNVGGGPLGKQFLQRLSALWGVTVRAGVTLQLPTPGIEGTEAIATPDGEFHFKESSLDGMFRMKPGVDGEAREVVAAWGEDLDRATLDRRYELVSQLLGGRKSAADRSALMALFETATPEDRRALYYYVEHHEWNGEFRHGLGESDDSLWNALGGDGRDRLRNLLNE